MAPHDDILAAKIALQLTHGIVVWRVEKRHEGGLDVFFTLADGSEDYIVALDELDALATIAEHHAHLHMMVYTPAYRLRYIDGLR